MPVKLNSSGGGSVTLDVGSTASTYTLNLPLQSGTLTTNTGPVFRAYLSSNTSITSSVRTRIPLNTVNFDTASGFNTTTNRYTPNVAGYYFITGSMAATGTSVSAIVAALWKNGSEVANTAVLGTVGSGTTYGVSDLIYLNGTTDYVELYIQINATSPSISGGTTITYMSGALVRAA